MELLLAFFFVNEELESQLLPDDNRICTYHTSSHRSRSSTGKHIRRLGKNISVSLVLTNTWMSQFMEEWQSLYNSNKKHRRDKNDGQLLNHILMDISNIHTQRSCEYQTSQLHWHLSFLHLREGCKRLCTPVHMTNPPSTINHRTKGAACLCVSDCTVAYTAKPTVEGWRAHNCHACARHTCMRTTPSQHKR